MLLLSSLLTLTLALSKDDAEKIIVPIAVPLAVKYVPILVAAGLAWLGARWDSLIRAKVKNEKLAGFLTRLDDAVFAAVTSVEQSYLSTIRKAAEDGVVTKAELEEAKRRALAEAKAQVGPDAWAEWCKQLGGEAKAEAALDARVESMVLRVKNNIPSVVPALRSKFENPPGLTR